MLSRNSLVESQDDRAWAHGLGATIFLGVTLPVLWFWPQILGMGKAATTVLEVFAVGDRLVWGAVWLAGRMWLA